MKGNVIEEMQPQYDNATDVLIGGRCAVIDEKQIEMPVFRAVRQAVVVRPTASSGSAAAAYYMPAKDGRPTGYCSRTSSSRRTWPNARRLCWTAGYVLMTPHDYPEWLKPNEAFVVSDVTVDELTGGKVMRQFASTGELIRALKNHSIYFSPDVRVTIHSRILQPFLDITLLFLGLPLVAARDNRNVFVAIGLCMGLVALFYVVKIACQQLGTSCLIVPSLAAWAPLMIFVPAAVGMSSAMWER